MMTPKLVDPLESLARGPVRSPWEVLEALSILMRRYNEGLPLNLPQVTLFLRSGREVIGLVREYGEFRQGRGVLLITTGGYGSHGEGLDVTFVPDGVIEALTLHDATVLDAPAKSMPESSPMHLRRHLPAMADTLSSAWGTKVTAEFGTATELEPDANIQPLAWLVERTGEVLSRLASTPDVGDVLRDKVRKVRLSVGESFGVKLANGTLDLTTSRRPPAWPLDSELAQAVMDTLP
ncbi:hypothetical protein JYK02_19385 [Corallococcus macrosporus]|uniref:Uncharacterized protein n=1 Tax=Corallococcus macrosporus TaxID=35 RepID=A0ABS3DDD2_9BACT|nr:hypothetical protein [Corallococcus macrosporus]MBN8229678.1 hypothetical protein [Corallococcus macrosporus]